VAKPPVVADLTWLGDLRFQAVSARTSITIDGDSTAGPSPVQALVFALAGCMAADVVFILTKGRHVIRALRARLTAQRAQENPHRILRVDLHFDVEGAVPGDAVQRAVSLSRGKYCSVWHSLNPDIDLQVTSDIRTPAEG
jgi:putative redox protein